MRVDPRFDAGFEGLVREQGLDRLDGFLGPLESFDEPPLYSRYEQLGFLDGVPAVEKNRLLVRAAAAHLVAVAEHVRGRDAYCMVSVLGWDEFDDGGLVWPAFFCANVSTRPDGSDPRGVLDYLAFDPPASRYGVFVEEAVGRGFVVQEGPDPRPELHRVYVRVDLYWSEVYQTLR